MLKIISQEYKDFIEILLIEAIQTNTLEIINIFRTRDILLSHNIFIPNNNRQYITYILNYNNQDIGFVCIAIDQLEVEVLYYFIDKQFRNQGFGKILFEEVLDQVDRLNKQKNKIIIRFKDDNQAMLKIVELHNFNYVLKNKQNFLYYVKKC